jgi:L,D-peptidoglycan transpeptidase YkuD (ErfK/YbiS/YcfS/YnhG family)
MSVELFAPRMSARIGHDRNPARDLDVRALGAAESRGMLQLGGLTFPCALGRGGISRTKREGDGATPAGSFELLHVYYRPDRGMRPRTALPVSPLPRGAGWCDDAGHARYNRLVALPFSASHETLWRDDALYDIVVVLDCNLFPAEKGKGSAIFFHLARPGYTPTEGCVALARRDMESVLARCAPGSRMRIG